MSRQRWYLLIHQLPPRPLYLRAKIRQRLEKVGAIPLKNSVYVLPLTEEGLEDLQWIAQEAAAGGGEAWVCEADFTFGIDSEELADRFRRARTADFEALAADIREALRAPRPRRRKGQPPEDSAARLPRFRKRLEELSGIDVFGSPARHEAEMALRSLEERLGSAGRTASTARPGSARDRPVGRTWVTRTGVHSDRIASAWLIRRFIDPEARFRFVPAREKGQEPDAISFDMVGGDYTHEGDRCTFETLVARFGLSDPALSQIAEVVHDVDLKDGKYGRADAPGIHRLIQGIVLAHPDDESRLERGFALFDDLYRSFSKGDGAPAVAREREPKKPPARAGRS